MYIYTYKHIYTYIYIYKYIYIFSRGHEPTSALALEGIVCIEDIISNPLQHIGKCG